MSGEDKERLARQVDIASRIAAAIADLSPAAVEPADFVGTPPDLLLRAIVDRPAAPASDVFPTRPTTPLSSGALLVNGRRQPRIGHEVATEMASADEVDLLCAFISGTAFGCWKSPSGTSSNAAASSESSRRHTWEPPTSVPWTGSPTAA